MEITKQEILKELVGEEYNYDLIMRGTKEVHGIKLRREVFEALKTNGHSNPEIAKYFNMSESAVWNGIKKVRGYIDKDKFREIRAGLVDELLVYTNGDTKALYYSLKQLGYSQSTIAIHFGFCQSKISKDVNAYAYELQFQEKRKNIVKF